MRRRVQCKVKVFGDVSSAGFRSLLQRQAKAWRVKGWVRELEPEEDEERDPADPQFEAVFHGSDADVDALVRWCERGPVSEGVTEVQTERMGLEAFFGFDVRR